MTSTLRQHDPDARRLLAELEALEAAPWPATLDDYAAALLALGQRCERAPGMAEFHRWSTTRLQGLLNGRSPAWREWRADALADVHRDHRRHAVGLPRRPRRPPPSEPALDGPRGGYLARQ